MAKAFIDDTNLTNIANAIRTKLGVSTQYLPSEMAGAILSIPKRKVVDFNVSSITLNGAKANSLQYVKAYGKCEQNGTPTPTTPVDIVCNNGALKARHESGLPLGYTLLDYIVFDGTQKIDTGFTPNQDSKIVSKFNGSTLNSWVYGTGSTIPGITCYLSTTGYQRFGNVAVDNTDISRNTINTVTQDKNGFYYNGQGKPYTSVGTFTAQNSLTIGNSNQSTGTPYFSGNFYYLKIYDNGTLVRDYVACKDSSNVVGFYDLVNGTFITDTGLTAGNTVSDPTIIYTEGNTETIRISSENLVDFTSLTIVPNTAISETGELVSNNGVNFCESYISVLPNQTYKISGDILGGYIGQKIYNFRLASYDVDKIFISRSDAVTGTEYTFTTDSTTKYIRFHYINTATLNTYKLQLDNIATCEHLLALPGYTDTQEILSGVLNRKVGIKVLDGSESWSLGGNNTGVWRAFEQAGTFDITDAICGHFQYTTGGDVNIVDMLQDHFCLYSNGIFSFKSSNTTNVNTWKEWLQTQYNNGTPVIVIYPLVTPTTESVAGQTLQVQAGDNTLEITQSALSGLEVECEYFLQ